MGPDADMLVPGFRQCWDTERVGMCTASPQPSEGGAWFPLAKLRDIRSTQPACTRSRRDYECQCVCWGCGWWGQMAGGVQIKQSQMNADSPSHKNTNSLLVSVMRTPTD